MSPPEKPEKKKPAKPQPETSSLEPIRPGLERRLRAARAGKSQPVSKLATLKELLETVKTAKQSFTLASVEIFEYAHIEKTAGTDEAIKLMQSIAKEIAAQLRQDDLVCHAKAGRLLIYFSDLGKMESTAVLERLSGQICRKNPRRAVAPQISLSFKILPPGSGAGNHPDPLDSPDERQLSLWISRYRFPPAFKSEREPLFLPARDNWNNSHPVLLKRINFPSHFGERESKHLKETLSSIQASGLPLLPRLCDFYAGPDFVYLVEETISADQIEQPFSQKSVHSLSISICDLFLYLDSLSPPLVPPLIAEMEFKQSDASHEPVLDSLDEYLVSGLLKGPEEHSQMAPSQWAESFSRLLERLFAKMPNDQCFSPAAEQLKMIAQEKRITGPLQKIRAILKKHEEKLRREHLSGLEDKT